MVRRTVGSALLVLLVGGPAGAQPKPQARPDGAEEADAAETQAKAKATEHVKAGAALFDKGNYSEALEEFRKARQHRRTRTILANIAKCLQRLDRHDEALEQYEEALREFPDVAEKVGPFVTELKALMGTVVVAGDVPEGATLLVDERPRGKLPLSAPLRVSRGVRAIRVEKEGFEPIKATVEVRAGQQAVATLSAKSKKGRLKVREAHGWPLQVELDGKDVGATTPWEGLVDAGEHRVKLHGLLDPQAVLSCEVPGADGGDSTEKGEKGEKGEKAPQGAKLESEVRTVGVRLYEEKEVTIGAEDRDTSLKIRSTPDGGRLWIDTADVGKTPWEGRLPLGDHTIEVRAKGFNTAKQTVTLERRTQPEVTLALQREPEPPPFWTGRTVGAAAAYGVGVVGLGLFAVTGGLALSKSADLKAVCMGGTCPGDQGPNLSDTRTLGNVALAGLIVAGTGAVTGTVVLFALRPGAAVKVGVGLSGVAMEGRF